MDWKEQNTFSFVIWMSIMIVLFIFPIDLSDGFRATEHVYLDHVICKYSPSYTANCSCKLNFITRMKKSYTSYCRIIKRLDDVKTHTQLYYKYRNGYQLFLVDIRLNGCDYARNKATSKLMDIVWPKIKQHLIVSQNLTCPFIGRFDIVDLPATGDFLNNMFVPVRDYMGNVTVWNNKDFIWNGKYLFNIPAGKTIEDDRMGR